MQKELNPAKHLCTHPAGEQLLSLSLDLGIHQRVLGPDNTKQPKVQKGPELLHPPLSIKSALGSSPLRIKLTDPANLRQKPSPISQEALPELRHPDGALGHAMKPQKKQMSLNLGELTP